MRFRMLNGYRVIHLPEHPRAMKSKNWDGFVYEHIVKAERSIGRELREGEHVHHLNGRRDDNRRENLLVLEAGQHKKLHNWMCGETRVMEVRYCEVCGICLDSENVKFCSSVCQSIFDRKVADRPSLEDLEGMLSGGMSYCAIGRKYGVSDNAVRKWIRSYKK